MIEASTGLCDMFIRFLSSLKGTLEKCMREKNSSVWAFQTASVARKGFFSFAHLQNTTGYCQLITFL